MTGEYTDTELLTTVASKILEDERTVMVGTGMPMLSAMLAQRTHAPDVTLVYEAGGIGADAPALPVSVGDERTFHRALTAAGMHEVMSYGQAGLIDYGFLGGAQIDRYGNLNSTVIGDWESPTVRFPGSGGANDIGSWANETIIAMRQREESFVEELDFRTTPGYLDGPGAREEAGLPSDTGPSRVITQLGVYRFDEETREMTLDALHPGVDLEEIHENSGFEINVPDDYGRSPEPTDEELRLLRDEIDPRGIIR
ncbi:Acyl CoA:acetate/3-ketoacid CoA transferase, beta subunit [Halalkaliarchaeum sp. AArc-CO]|uniref:CoA-transferase subunit beta n=1 Tax=Halalkaliarchaeum sp. AArc-CO TaxID=2866381 RepID=UPI00217D2937|nr:CoA-transferase [Halalkaliarchaeum sp. AArc-CO]UWG52132.1 Acyl CoA:acetate/3-ketoacid CoA transferase, beta subunit [Halalkaliarchaeum sp. AArc-CO]